MRSNPHHKDKISSSSTQEPSPSLCSKFLNPFILKLDLTASENESLTISNKKSSKLLSTLSVDSPLHLNTHRHKPLIVRSRSLSIPQRMKSISSRRSIFSHKSSRANGISSTSLPHSVETNTSNLSSRSKRLMSKMKCHIDAPFGLFWLRRTKKSRSSIVGRKIARKPSTLDFRCIGMVDEYYFGSTEQVAPRIRTGSPVSCAPRIHWCKPDIHSDWNKDWFSSIGVH